MKKTLISKAVSNVLQMVCATSDEEDEGHLGMNMIDLLPNPNVITDPDKRTLTLIEVEERLATLHYGKNVTKKEKIQFEDIFCKYINVFAFNYKDLKEVTLQQHRIELEETAKFVRQKQRRVSPPIVERRRLKRKGGD